MMLSLSLLYRHYFPLEPSSEPKTIAATTISQSSVGSLENTINVEEKPVNRETIEGTIGRGETLSSLFDEYFSARDIYRLAKECEKTFPVRDLCAGQPYCMLLEDGCFRCFTYEIDSDDQLFINYENEQFIISKAAIAYQVERAAINGIIESSLFLTVSQLGEKPELACRLADIFAWDIDFMRDLRLDDSFRVLIEKRYRDGTFTGYGRLLAAEFVNQGESYRAVYFADKGFAAYYDSEGQSLKKAFLKAPLSYSRISSGYSNRRLHPVLRVWRPHRAIDYAAPVGTPVKAVADGVVSQRSYDKSNGNKIRLRHPNQYETTYIHLSRFGRGIKIGKKVTQGQIIGYVGATGLATGPHLDYRVFKNGRPINPLKIESIPSVPLSQTALPEFKLRVQEYFEFLDREISSSVSNDRF
ncbi:MAG: peptidoglycan DD-metalloendopeptidase family protein [Pseudomonadota bacterium]|nr:peptidoglycan DD-metalloendopeptidase family protein [Pseudomonadota bacterium]